MKDCPLLAAIRELAAQPTRQLLLCGRGLRGDDLAREGRMERRSLQLSPPFHLQERNRSAPCATQPKMGDSVGGSGAECPVPRNVSFATAKGDQTDRRNQKQKLTLGESFTRT